MKVFTNNKELQSYLQLQKDKGLKIGFVPTMGALHKGHMSLIAMSVKECDISVCSIFVNPTQFNESSDLKKYPRTLEADKNMLEENGNHVLYFPEEKEVYPPNLDTSLSISFDGLDEKMEGEFRPGHFKGVAQVVKRLLDIVEPDRLYMGQKDFQQFTIIHYMIEKMNLAVQLRVCKIVREDHGLAMSSRNERLPLEIRRKANVIYKTLLASRRRLKNESIQKVREYAIKRISKDPDFKMEYFDFTDGNSLTLVEKFDDTDYLVACTAVWAGNVRLIDNMIMKRPKQQHKY